MVVLSLRGYSAANLLNEEISSYWNRKNKGVITRAFGNLLKQSHVILSLHIPKPLYFRAEILCEDISELSGIEFDHEDLLSLLYQDFLTYLKKHQSLDTLYNHLTEKSEQFFLIHDYKQTNQETNLLIGSFDSEPSQKRRSSNMATLMFRTKRKDILRGEVALSDLAEVYPNHTFTLEQVLEMIYCEFIEKYRRGKSEKAVANILSHLEEA